MDPEQKKEVSDLKFSDFSDAKIAFKHDAKGLFEACDIGDEEAKDMGKNIESLINLDCSMKWKAVGLFKAGETLGKAMMASQIMDSLKGIPDNMPGEIVKAFILLALMGGGERNG
jgi:hypothetical protein